MALLAQMQCIYASYYGTWHRDHHQSYNRVHANGEQNLASILTPATKLLSLYQIGSKSNYWKAAGP